MDQVLLDRTCRLAELELSESEKENMLTDLENMVSLFETISELDTEGVTPLSGVLEVGENVLREDVVAERDAKAASLEAEAGDLDARTGAAGLDARAGADVMAEREALLRNAPALQDGLFVVPKTFS